MPCRRTLTLLAGASLALVAPRAAYAASETPDPPAGGASSTPGHRDVDPAREDAQEHIPPRSLVWRPWALFDPYLSPQSRLLDGGPVWERLAGQAAAHGGFEAAIGRSIESSRGHWLTRLSDEVSVRLSGSSHWVLSLPRYSYAGGLTLGPVEVSARAGVTIAQAHFGSGGLGVGFLSPRVSLGVAARAGGLRVGLVTFSEWAWRWVGGPSALVHGILLEVAVGHAPAGLPSFYRVENR